MLKFTVQSIVTVQSIFISSALSAKLGSWALQSDSEKLFQVSKHFSAFKNKT